MSAREPSRLEALREAGRYIDYGLLPSANEIPGVLAALIYGDELIGQVRQHREDGLTDAQISHEVAHWIAPPDPEAGATIVQGVPPEAHQALLDEVAQLREAVRELTQGRERDTLPAGPAHAPAVSEPVQPAGAATASAPPVVTPDTMTEQQRELQELREEIQNLRIGYAAGQHPTAQSEPVPADEAQ